MNTNRESTSRGYSAALSLCCYRLDGPCFSRYKEKTWRHESREREESLAGKKMTPKRSACKECYERKIRCRVPSQGGSCQACLTSRRQCYFLPRHKAGRPRRGSRSLPSTLSSPHNSPVIDVSDNVSAWNAGQILLSLMDHVLTVNDISSLCSPEIAGFTGDMFPDYVLIDDTAGFWPQSHSNCGSDSGSSSWGREGGDPLEGHRFPNTTSGSISPPWPVSVACPGDSTSHENSSVSFARLLEKCSELEQSAGMLNERDQSTINHIAPIPHAIDALCDPCATFIDNHSAPCRKEPLDPALLALAIAANFKILQVCGLLVSISTSDAQRPHTQMPLKRIGFNLMQT